MAKEEEKTTKEEKKTTKKGVVTEVTDPEVFRPKELPILIKGDWANEAQERYARTLNAYAYKNTVKWAKKKEVLLKQLEQLADNPELINRFEGESLLWAEISGEIDVNDPNYAGRKLTFTNKAVSIKTK